MTYIIKKELIEHILRANPKIKYDMASAEAVEQVQTSVDWFLQMPRTSTIRKSSPSVYHVKHRIERQPTGYKGPITTEATLIAAIILGFPICKNYDRIGVDEKYYQKWKKVNTEVPETIWTFMYWGKE